MSSFRKWYWRGAATVIAGAVLGLSSEGILRAIISALTFGPAAGNLGLPLAIYTGSISLFTMIIYGGLTYWLTDDHDEETRCRKCGYILKGITEPRCSECGELI